MDVHDKATRSFNMSRISNKDTSIELIVRRFLFHEGFRYNLKNKHIPGNPDIVFAKYKIAIFINGCFFHDHKNCDLVKPIRTNEDFWRKKIQKNVDRDIKNTSLLQKNGWKVIILWECEIEPRKRNSPKRNFVLENLKFQIQQIIKFK